MKAERLKEIPKQHELKVWPVFYDALATGIKTFEVRYNDRNFNPGHTLRLREYSPTGGAYSGRECQRIITYVLSGDECPGFGVEPGYVVLGLAEIERLSSQAPLQVSDRWDFLEESDKQFLRRLVLGAPVSLSFPERLDAMLWSVTTLVNMAVHREEALKYFKALDGLLYKINERVGAEAWERALSDSAFVAAAERGKQAKAAGKAVPYFSGK